MSQLSNRPPLVVGPAAAKPGAQAVEKSMAADAEAQTVRISPLAFLRSMAVIFWSAFRHPFSTTEVDLSTGKVLRHY